MKRGKCIILALIILLFSIPTDAFAHGDRREHFNDIELVLFGVKDGDYGKSKSLSREAKKKLRAIEYASILTLDQYNGTDSTLLLHLKLMGNIPDLPPDVIATKSDNSLGINYKSYPNIHRAFTHRGWDYSYLIDEANWEVRKNILINTVNAVFTFSKPANQRESKGYAFCALIYYIHIIGDQEEDSAYAPAEIIMPLGRDNTENTNNTNESNPDVFSQLAFYLPRLFRDQTDSLNYLLLMKRLDFLSKKVRKVAEGGVSKKEEAEYQRYAKKLLTILSQHIPSLLENESFFSDVFPPNKDRFGLKSILGVGA